MSNIQSKKDEISLLMNISEEEEEDSDEKDLITIELDSIIIRFNYSQLCKYSQKIRSEYLITDVKNRLPEELQRFKEDNLINLNNIKIFFQLVQDEKIVMSNDKYKDLFKLSEFFKVKKLLIFLKKYSQTHIEDSDFVIRLFLDEINNQNKSNKVDYAFKIQMERLIIDKINECLQNELFLKFPVSLIFNFLEKKDENKISSDILFDFIKKSPDTLYVLLKFIKIQNLSNDKFNELFEVFADSKKFCLQYLLCNIDYIKLLRESNQDLKNQQNQLELNQNKLTNENSSLKSQLSQSKQDIVHLENQLKIENQKLKAINNELNDNLNSMKDKNQELKEKNDKLEDNLNYLKDENEKLKAINNELNDNLNYLKDENRKLKEKNDKLEDNSNQLKQIEIDFSKMIREFEESARQGNSNSLYFLGKCYSNGWHFKKDYLKAVDYYQKASELGNSDALNGLGNCYSSGQGFEKDYIKAIEYYRKASDLGNPKAFNNLGNRYYYGQGVDLSYSKAIEYYQKAAELGNVMALNNLGNCYFQGRGVKQDYSKAVEYYQKASEFGNSMALYSLGKCYYNGNGVEQDYLKAIEYYQKSSDLGNLDALRMLDEAKRKEKEKMK